jgi:hypothetical protein
MLNRTTPPEPKKPRECTKYKRNLKSSPSNNVKAMRKLPKELFSLCRNFLNDQKMMDYRDLCKYVLDIDGKIRFAGIATADGKILAAEYRQELVPLLNQEESELSIMQSLIRMSTRHTVEEKLGKTIFSYAEYEKLKRVTIMRYDKEGNNDSMLLSSLDRDSDHEALIRNKILPFLN